MKECAEGVNVVKQLKRGLLGVLCLLLLVAYFPSMTIFASGESATTGMVTVGNAQGKVGEEVQITLSFDDSVTIQSLAISEIDYDKNKLELVNGEWNLKNSFIADWNSNGNDDGVLAFAENKTISGKFFTFTFKITEDAKDGDTSITCNVGARAKVSGGSDKVLDITVNEGKVTIETIKQFVSGWKQDAIGWWYQYADGSYPYNCWKLIDNKWYFFNPAGYRVANSWRKDSKGWVYLGADGAMLTNAWCTDSSGWCYVGPDGYAVTNCWKRDSIGWIWLNSNGSMTKSSWIKDAGKWYYLDASGYMVSNSWRKDSKGWVYLGASGVMLTNAWCTDSQGWCYVGADGYAVTNCWKKDSIGWIWLNSNGSMTKSAWIKDGGKWYYLDARGYMVTGRQFIGNKWYNFNSSGVWVG